ncbi:MAG: PEGA domain-containing protein [Alistipes sp.]|nr:PEGA domain-containing protein [Alistipes sp.]
MKKIFTILLSLLICATATAQVENSIVIDIASLRAVQQDALTGVNIDPIGLDHSRQACARVKIKFDRMNRQQIEALEVKMRSNTDLTKQKVADYYDNVLILEMTAKPNTRFYFVSPEFGESNEVTLNLEGNREYELEAALNQTFSIIVNTNVANADIYIDDLYKGQTGATNSLTVKDVLIGAHTLKVKYGKMEYSQAIEVNSGSIAFRQNVDTQASKPQFVVFAVEPTNAVVTINGTLYTLQDGAMQIVLENGTYNYTVSASGYHSQSGSFTVAGSKVERIITLTADVATVTITAAENAEIWVNNIMKGSGSWTGTLTAGTYIFEARKAGHRTTSITRQISSKEQNQKYTLPAPTPIYGSLLVSGTPIMADVALDGNTVGRIPLELGNILIGNHTLVVSKAGYNSQTQTITVTEGKTTTVNISLTKQSSPVSSTPVSSGQITSGKGVYKVGDYYNDGVKEGVVFEVSADGRSGKIVSMTQSGDDNMRWSNDAEQKKKIGAYDKYDGRNNMAVVRRITNWQNLYPGFAWCAALGADWYLPAIEELKVFTLNQSVYDAVNKTLQERNATPLLRRGGEYKGGAWYWSSTENGVWDSNLKQYEAWHVAMKSIKEFASYKSYPYRNVRAIARFGSANAQSAPTSGVYKVGDYYNDGVKEGVVFEVSADGRSGKILNLQQAPGKVVWAADKAEQKRLIGTKYTDDGEKNTNIVKAISGWQTKYPSFNWCASLGNDWYLPAKEEVEKFVINDAVRNAINQTIEAKGGVKIVNRGDLGWYWSSTETDRFYDGSYGAIHIRTSDGYVGTYYKHGAIYVRAVAKFGSGSSSYTPAPVSTPTVSGNFKIGDIYDDGVKRGVIFDINGSIAKIVSLSKRPNMVKWAEGNEATRNIGATNTSDGEENFNVVKKIANWRKNYPAFAWCASLGEGWYLPAKGELETIQRNKALIEPRLTDKLSDNFYFSSTESYTEEGYIKCVYDVGMKNGSNIKNKKSYHSYVIAVAKVKINNSSSGSTAYMSPSNKVYRVGDLYNENGKKGVVFEVDATGRHGKIISVECSPSLMWATGAEQSKFIGATDIYDGQKNMDVVKQISGWQSKYPVFYWCANLGSGWYLPAKEEWSKIYRLRSSLESKLSRKLDNYFWSSTERNEVYKNQYCAWNIHQGDQSSYCKDRTNIVFAVAKF